jgi:polyisoprenoid-binding protein YceI
MGNRHMSLSWRIVAAIGCLASGLACAPVRAMPLTYKIAPGSTDIGFTVDVLGLTSCTGEFSKFSGTLTVDLDQPELSAVDVKIDANSAAMEWSLGTQMILGESYLDAGRFPVLQFVSEHVVMLSDGRVKMDGILTLRGISHQESFIADLSERHWNKDKDAEQADFTATGTVKRSDYRMDRDQGLLDDQVTFTIHARLLMTSNGFNSASVR